MSGYRVLHREFPPPTDKSKSLGDVCLPWWTDVKFVPRRRRPSSSSLPSPSDDRRILLTSGLVAANGVSPTSEEKKGCGGMRGVVRIYSASPPTSSAAPPRLPSGDGDEDEDAPAASPPLSASALTMTHISDLTAPPQTVGEFCFGAVDCALLHGHNGAPSLIVAAVSPSGRLCFWSFDDVSDEVRLSTSSVTCVTVDGATGTSVALDPAPSLATPLTAVGTRNGSVALVRPSGTDTAVVVAARVPSSSTGARVADDCICSLAWSLCGTALAAGQRDGRVSLWAVGRGPGGERPLLSAVGKDVRHSGAKGQAVRAIAFAGSEGGALLVGTDDGCVRLYDVGGATGEEGVRWSTPIQTGTFWAGNGRGVVGRGWVTAIDCAPDGRRFVASYADRNVKVWDLGTRQCLHSFDGHEDIVWSAVFDDTGERIASCGLDGILQIYKAEE